jgi:putative DNA primase/helicase
MSYMTMEEQIASHLTFLREEQLLVEELVIDEGFIRCSPAGGAQGRGELCYQSKKTLLRNGLTGLMTWLRTAGGEIKTHKTYGLAGSERSPDKNQVETAITHSDEAIKKAKLFWQMSDETGESEYLLKKGVGYYRIRFRQTDFGKIAVIPMEDGGGNLFSYQLINADGSKRFAKDVGNIGLLHMLQRPIDGRPIGLAESYVTAASCFEITGMAMVTSFSSENLKSVGMVLRKRFPQSHLTIFGDNDRHLHENKGRRAALSTQEALGTACDVVIPDFEGSPLSRDFSDWNDYVRENGVRMAREAMQNALKRKLNTG